MVTTQSIDARVDALLAQMTLDEKLAQLGGMWVADLIDEKREFAVSKAHTAVPHGIGHISRIGSAAGYQGTLLKSRLNRNNAWAHGHSAWTF